MKLARFRWRNENRWGVLEDDRIFSISGDVYGEFRKGGELCSLQDVKLLAPAEPAIMVCVGINYRAATNATGDVVEEKRVRPRFFFKPPTALSNPLDGVRYPADSQDPHLEAELCAVIKRRAKDVSVDDALNHVLGYTCGNELGAMDFIREDKNLTRGRGFDTSGPIGPYLVTDLDTSNLGIRSRVNGETKQDSNTNQLLFNVAELIHHITAFMTLQPGDVIWTGTPPGRSPVKVGDVMEVEIEGIGILRNEVMPY